MKKKSLQGNGKVLSRIANSHRDTYPKLRGEALTKAIKEAQRDPKFMAEIRKFIKITTS